MDSPLSWQIDERLRRVRVVYEQQPSIEQWTAAMEAVFADPQFEPGFGILIDRTKVVTPATTDYVRRLVGFIDDQETRIGRSRWAVIVADLGSFGMGRMAEQIGSTQTIRTCWTPEEAEAWLSGGR